MVIIDTLINFLHDVLYQNEFVTTYFRRGKKFYIITVFQGGFLAKMCAISFILLMTNLLKVNYTYELKIQPGNVPKEMTDQLGCSVLAPTRYL